MANFGSETSKFKMVIYLNDNEKKVFYSLENEDKRGENYSVDGMVRRLLERMFKNKYHTAVIYDLKTNSQVLKFVNGKQVLS